MMNKYLELLKNVEQMSLEEIAAVEKEIDEIYNDAVLYNKKKTKKNKKAAEEKTNKYKYPFIIHIAGRNIETDHIFENDTVYNEKEITTKMREHQYYDFTGDVTFDYIESENVLVPIFRQHKKG